MKDMLKDFCNLLANSVTIICLALASFLILINLYHYKEVNYVYNTNVGDKVDYKEFREMLDNVEKKMGSEVTTTDYKKKNISGNLKTIVGSCINSIKESTMYKMANATSLTQKDIYNTSSELYGDINNNCLFYLWYNTEQIIDSQKVDVDFKDTSLYIQKQRDLIMASTDYLSDRILNNSSYNYVTDITRNSIFNETSANFSFSVRNYTALVTVLDTYADWYVSEFGGAR